ncbi:unnamed protein product [Mytilus edulis]|uniref:MYND-type domain-containing protein n=1 Tax=Mytilus edulis TaxID=6550 RepID=A0A8S3QL79_MYTED|nr:unnamed protein product [Mytilus edulis]
MNYEAVNNNHLKPRVRRQPDVGKYDYKITSHVDFSKLFLTTSMAHYTAFDETCDLSALLGIIINIDQFPKPVQIISLKVRSDVRNPWAHCNFDEWDTIKYQTAFQLLHQLVRCLQLNTTDETNIQAELNKWETNGFMFLQGYGVNQQVVKEIRQQTRALADYTLKMKSGLDSTFAHVHDAIFKINGEIMLACSRISSIESKQNEQQTDIDNFHTHISEIILRCLSLPEKTLFYPPNRSETFIAREVELSKLKDICIGKCNENHTLVICGLGGCGKTTLAIEFAWRSQEYYPAGVFWMSAETQDSLEDSLTTLAIDVDTTGKDFRETFKRALKWLSSLNERWLLVVDNIDEEYLSDNTKQLLLGSWKRNTRGHILITSRREPNEVEESMVAAFSPIKINKSRLAITTTWKLNIDYITRQSENEGLGSPFVDDSSLVEVLDDEIGCKQVIEILTRFSLFQRKSDSSLSVHRLVQEVIRDDMHDTHRCLILQHAMRMVNKALYSSQSPVDVMYNDDSNTKEVVGTLVKWGKFAANANSIKMYGFNLKKDEIPSTNFFFNKEILRILQTTALYHSIHQRQAIALADQAQMIRIMTTADVDTHFLMILQKIKIPLLQRDREKIVDSLVSVIPVETKETGKYTPVVTAGAETLRILGNEAFKEQRYQDAIRYYTAGIKSSPITHIDCRLFSNRSIAYIRIRDFTHAFSDANRCIDIESENWKGYCWRAYAISGLIEDKTLPPTMEAMGLASACIASYKHPPCLLQCDMLMRYPIINYQMVERPEWLRQNIVSLTDRPFTTLLLRKGLYTFNEKLITTKSIQVIGIEDGVDIDTGPENIIQGNGSEGIWCGGVSDSNESENLNDTGASKAVLIDNDIGQNGLSGISCDGCYIEIKGNRVFSNNYWGIVMKLRSSAYILNNDIFYNKCGGIRIGHNYTASVIIDGNTIRDHNGPGVYTLKSIERVFNKIKDWSDSFVGNYEILGYSRPPVITSTNLFKNNDKGTLHPSEVVRLIEACSFCRQVSHNLKACSKCKKATYCSKDCQSKHWLRHKHMCKLLRSSYVVEVPMSEIEPNNFGASTENYEPNAIRIRRFNPKLKGILEGTPPNRRSHKRFIVKIQSGKEYAFYNPNKKLVVYDQTVKLDIQFSNPTLYHLCMECGVLASAKLTTKKYFAGHLSKIMETLYVCI